MPTNRSRSQGAGPVGPRSSSEVREELSRVEGVITALEVQQKDPHRRSVYIDGRFVLGLHEESIILGGLKKGARVDGALLLRAWRLDEAKRAWDAALGLLALTARTAREVERRLARRFEPEVVHEVMERLMGGGWLNDEEYARSYIRSHGDMGEQRLLQDLLKKGVAREAALAAIGEVRAATDAYALAREAAAARLARMPGLDRETAHRRLASYLARRGFGWEAISAVLGPLLADLPAAPRGDRAGGGGVSRKAGGGLKRSGWGRRSADADGFEPEPPEEEE